MVAMTIGGESVAGETEFGVIDPASEETFASAPDCSARQLDEAMQAAQRAFGQWRRDIAARRIALVHAAEIVQAHGEELAQLITREQGKPLAKARREVAGTAAWIRYTAKLEIPCEIAQDDEQIRVEVRRRPCGVVAAITPWNYPLISAAWKFAPALLAGNTMVLKPSPFTPLATLRLGELLLEALPPGVLNVVSGGDALGKRMTSHPSVRKISFTGSIEAGKHVAASAAPDLKRVTLELGGNDAAIVFEDVDVKAAAQKLFWGAFENSGQVCIAIKRLYVQERIFGALLEELTRIAKNTKVGPGCNVDTELGPLNNRPQFERVQELCDDARRVGGRVTAGGARVGARGYFFEPTIVTGLADDARLVAEEQFGPILPCLPFASADEALARANATHFGLAGSVWSADRRRAEAVAGEMDCGTVWINQHLSVLPSAPVGGHKWSGIGVENGSWGLLGFTEIQTVEIPKVW
jgi:acyl-CoA reductase-like NAD-dependent aldehyde dehydrogenase